MKIYSKFQDYYDSALGSFMASEVVVNRKQSSVQVPYKDMESLGDFRGEWNYIEKVKFGTSYGSYPISMIGFCGHWYFFKHNKLLDSIDIDKSTIEYKTFDEIKTNNEKTGLFGQVTKNYINPDNLSSWSNLFEKYGPVLFIKEYNPPARYWNTNTNKNMSIEIWPELKPYKFQLVKDTFTALWEIEHWIDTHARPDEAIVPVGDDVTRLQAYGFDKKTSFRKPKEK